MSLSKQAILQKPGYLGRALRFVAGAWQIYFVSEVLQNFDWIIYRSDFFDWGMVWFGVAIAFYYLHEAINLGFSVTWGRSVQRVLFFSVLLAGVITLIQSGTFWGPFVTLLLIIPSIYICTFMSAYRMFFLPWLPRRDARCVLSHIWLPSYETSQ